MEYADEFLLTAAAQRNRNHLEGKVEFEATPFALEELLFDPQTSGGLLVSVPAEQAEEALAAVQSLGLGCGIIGHVTDEHPGVIRVTE